MIQAAYSPRKHWFKREIPTVYMVDKLKTSGPVLALDLGQKYVGAAVSDDRLVTIKRLPALKRSNWKQLLKQVENLVSRLDAQTLVIGLPLRLDGTFGSAAEEANRLAGNFAKSLKIPVYLQDERLTSFEARESLLADGHDESEIKGLIDGEAAALILRDFLHGTQPRTQVEANFKQNP
jgi:putative Holliday junction resolvase